MRAAWIIAAGTKAVFALARARGATHSGELVANTIKTGTSRRIIVISRGLPETVGATLAGSVLSTFAE
jgi:hypothetical protein